MNHITRQWLILSFHVESFQLILTNIRVPAWPGSQDALSPNDSVLYSLHEWAYLPRRMVFTSRKKVNAYTIWAAFLVGLRKKPCINNPLHPTTSFIFFEPHHKILYKSQYLQFNVGILNLRIFIVLAISLISHTGETPWGAYCLFECRWKTFIGGQKLIPLYNHYLSSREVGFIAKRK